MADMHPVLNDGEHLLSGNLCRDLLGGFHGGELIEPAGDDINRAGDVPPPGIIKSQDI